MFNREYIINTGIVAMENLKYGEDGVFLMEATYKAKEIVAIPDFFYNYDIRGDGMVGCMRKPLEWFDIRYSLMLHRYRIRKMVSEVDMQQYYLGTNVFSSLRQAINLSEKLIYFKQFDKFVTHHRCERVYPSCKHKKCASSICYSRMSVEDALSLYFVYVFMDSTENGLQFT